MADGGGGNKNPRGSVNGEKGRKVAKLVEDKRRGTGPWRWPDIWPRGASWLRRPAAFPCTEVSNLVFWYSPLEEELLLLPFSRWRKRLRRMRIFRRANTATCACTRPSV